MSGGARRIDDLLRPIRCFFTQTKPGHVTDVRCDPCGAINIRLLLGPANGSTKIVELSIQPLIGGGLVRTEPCFELAIAFCSKELRMSKEGSVAFSDCRALVLGKLPDGLQHAVAQD